MNGYQIKRKIAAALCAMMAAASMPLGALAEAELIEKIVPAEGLQASEKMKKIQKIEKLDLEESALKKLELEPKKIRRIEAIEKIVPAAAESQTAETLVEKIEPSADLEKKEDMLIKPETEVLKPLTPPASTEPVYSKIEADVTTGADSITVTITQASAEPMYVFVGDDFKDGMHKGDSATFSGLTPGKYDVEVDYEEGTNVFRTTATIEAPDTPPPSGAVDPIVPPSSGTVDPIVPPSSGTVDPIVPPSSGTVDPIVPPSSGTVDPIVPPSSGTVDPIVPPSSGTVDPIVPPSSGTVDPIVPPSSGTVDPIVPPSSGTVDPIVPPSSGTVDPIVPPSSGTVDPIVPPSSGAVDPIVPPSSGAVDPIVPPSSGTVDPIVPPSSGTVDPIVPPSSGTVDPIVPPSSGTVDPIVPPSSGTVDPIVPPSSGTVDPIVPPSSGTVDPIVPPPSGADKQSVKAFTILPVETDGAIAVVIDGASDREVEVTLQDKDGKRVGAGSIIGSGLVNLGRFASGTYTVRAQYVTPVQAEDGSYDFKTVTAQVSVPEGVTTPKPDKPVDIQAKIEKGKDYIIITVTESADIDMMASVEGLGDKPITKGGSVRYDGLTPGQSYGVEIDYINYVEGAKKYSATVTIDKPEMLGEIKITAVTPGTNMLTVSGTATAGKQVILTTKPVAAGDVYAVANEKGVFKAEIPCSAGVYTAVTAKYSADTSKSHEVTGKWTVAAPAEKPKLTIDPIDTSSTTVIAKTTPGVVVEIKTSDYSQKVTADAKGIVRFSLPHTYKAGKEFTFTVFYGDNQSFTQKVKVAEIPYLGMLTYGDTGDDVKKLTKRLKELGYLDDSTSRYGSTVREAVRLFQRANGLDADGIAGPLTQQKLFSVSAIAFGSDTYPTLVRGDRGYALIYTLQQRLKDLGYYTIKVDGIYGSGTQRAVREFQRINGLSITGKADNATQALLYSSAAKPAGGSIAPSGNYQTLSRSGRYKSAVVPMQRRLRALGYYSGNIDGYFGSQTYRAVRNFQSRNRLTVTGVADSYTQQVLYSASAKAYSGSSSSGSSSTSVGYRLLYWGCRGDAVKKLQQALINAGYKSIVRSADGIFGQWTYDAVRAYQKDHGLAVDGIAGKNTQNALYGTKY